MQLGHLLLLGVLVRGLAAEVITGTVTGHDGKPVARAMVILRDGAGNDLQSEYSTEDGRYRLNADAAGLYRLQFIGSFHENLTVYVEARGPGERDVWLDARLATHQYQPEIQPRLFVYSDPVLNQRPFSRQADGTWVIELETAKPELVVGISGAVTTGAVAIPDSAEYRRQFNRMLSVLRPKDGKIRVVLDPQRFPRSDRAEEITFRTDAGKRQAIQNACVTIIKETQRQLESKRRKAGITAAASPAMGEADLELMRHQASQQEKGPLREVHWLLFLVHAVERPDADRASIRRTLDEVPAGSPFWALAFEQAAKAAGKLGAPDPLFAIAAAQPTPALRVEAYRQFLWSATPSMRARLLDRMMEEFPAHDYTKAAMADYSPAIRPGGKVPDFAIPSLAGC